MSYVDEVIEQVVAQNPAEPEFHQAVKEVAPGFRVCARAADGVIEAMESTEYKSMLGVNGIPNVSSYGVTNA